MKFKIKEIDLMKYYLLIISYLILSILISLLIIFFLLQLKISVLSNGDYYYLIFVITNLIIFFSFLKMTDNYSVKTLEILINKNEFIINENRTISIDKIESYNVKSSMKNFPSFEIKLKNNEKYKFHCKNKADNEFDSFIREFEKTFNKKSERI